MTNLGGECIVAWKEEEEVVLRFVEEVEVMAAVCGRAEDCVGWLDRDDDIGPAGRPMLIGFAVDGRADIIKLILLIAHHQADVEDEVGNLFFG